MKFDSSKGKSIHDMIIVCEMRVYVDNSMSVTDVMTAFRVLQGVEVVGQTDHSIRSKMGRTMLPISVKYFPESASVQESISILARRMKSVPGVKVIKLLTVEDKPYTNRDGTPIVY